MKPDHKEEKDNQNEKQDPTTVLKNPADDSTEETKNLLQAEYYLQAGRREGREALEKRAEVLSKMKQDTSKLVEEYKEVEGRRSAGSGHNITLA